MERANIFSEIINMKDAEEVLSVFDTVDILHKLLNEHNIQHAFTYPRSDDLQKDSSIKVQLFYKTEDVVLVSLLYMVYLIDLRKCNPSRLEKPLDNLKEHIKKVGVNADVQ